MYTRNKPPPIPTPNPPRSPSNKKENLDDAPVDKRRKIGVGKMVAPLSNSRSRQVLSAVNAGPVVGNGDPMPAVGSDCGSSTCGVEFNSREDVERLLGEKMKGKSKNDFKGKSEQMSEYIKKLRVCVKWFMEVEDGYLVELGKLQSTVESEEKRHTEIEAQMKSKEEKLEATVGELRRQYESLQESYRKEEAAKLATMKSYKEEMEARVAAENSRAALSEDLVKASQEAKRANDQISELQQLNKRLQEYNNSLQQYNTKLQTDNADYTKTNSMLQKEKNAMMETMTGLRAHTTLLQEQLATLRSSQQEANKQKEELKKEVCCLRSDLQQVRDDRDNQLAQVQSLTAEIAKYKEVSGKSSMDLERVMLKANVLEESCCSQREQIQLLQHQLAAANEKLKMTDLTTVEMKAEYEQQKETIINLKNHVVDAKRQIHEAEELRKKLHNTIQELKGNIRVFCRVRPVLPENDFSATEGAIVSYPTSTEMLGRGIELMHQGQNHLFNFDKVFHHEASQEEVFLEISQVIQSALDGYKVCIFAYGQTGSGKTYTMMGEREPPEQKGLIPRSLEQIFQTSQSKQSQGWRFKMQASMLEIYNETIRDLLSTNDVNGIPSKQRSIKLDPNGSTHVPDLTIVDVYSSKEVSSLLRQAAQSRSVGKTQMNEQSSRSHFVFTLRISGDNESTEQHVQGVLNLIDLAGSERLSRSGATGDRLKETQAINKSLSCLSDVFLALAKKDAKKDDQHVPYRNSILTYLLKPCLGGDSKTLMFVNISPEASSAGESLCSLRFATRVNSCEIGVARRQTQPRNPDSRLSYG